MAIIRTFLHFYTNVVRAYTENKTHHLTENQPHPAMVVSRYTPFVPLDRAGLASNRIFRDPQIPQTPPKSCSGTSFHKSYT